MKMQAIQQKKLAILASGSGTNAENIMAHFTQSATARVELVVTNRQNAGVVARAEMRGIPVRHLSKSSIYESNVLLEVLWEFQIDWVILAGFLLRIPVAVVKAFPGRILNIHPALLPKYGGQGMYGMNVHRAVVEHGEKESGITIHVVDEEYDRGPVVFQKACPVEPQDSPEDVQQKVQQLEYRYFPQIIENCIREA